MCEPPRRTLEKARLGTTARIQSETSCCPLDLQPTDEDRSSNYRISTQSLFKILAYSFCLPFLPLVQSWIPLRSKETVFISRNQDSLPSENWFTYLRMILLLLRCQQILEDGVPEIAEIIFRLNSIDTTFYYPRKNHKTLVPAHCIPRRWKTFILSVTVFTRVPQFPRGHLEQVTIRLYYLSVSATGNLTSPVDNLEVSGSQSSEASWALYLSPVVRGQDRMCQLFYLRGTRIWGSARKDP